jgi:HAAS domain-containing protein
VSVTNPTDVVEAYISDVRARLADVPEEDRADLLEDVASHVREIADEFGPESLQDRLGSPADFAAELRASAGYADVAEEPAAPSRMRRAGRAVAGRVRTDANRELWRKLEPGWWVVRGVLVGYLALWMTGAHPEFIPRLGNSHLLGLGVLVVGAVGSFKLGERRPATQSLWLRRTRIAAEVGLVFFALTYVGDAGSTHVVFVDNGVVAQPDACLRDSAGRPISNLYAFDASGQAIPQFFLTDEAGRPIDNLCPDQVEIGADGPPKTTYAKDTNGAPVYGVFPRQQTVQVPDPATGNVTERPVTPPAVVFPQLATTTTTPEAAPQ